jgi:hypothetical protein
VRPGEEISEPLQRPGSRRGGSVCLLLSLTSANHSSQGVKLAADALHGASPEAQELGSFQDPRSLRKLPSRLPFGRAVYLRRPSLTPWATARLSPALTRCLIIVRSNSAKAPVTWKTNLPIGVVVSIDCWSKYRSTPHASKC